MHPIWLRNSLLVLFCFCGLLFAQNPKLPNIAVSDFTGDATVTPEQLQFISGKMAAELLASGAFTVLERGRMQTILREQGFQQAGNCSGSECQVQIGQLLGVDQLVTGSLVKFGPTYMVRLDLLDVGTGRILKSVDLQKKGELYEIVVELCSEAAQKLAQSSSAATPKVNVPSGAVPVQGKSHSWKLPVAIGLGLAGVGGLVLGKLADQKMVDYRTTYRNFPATTSQTNRDITWENAQNEQSKRNLFYGVGGALLALGLTVQFVF